MGDNPNQPGQADRSADGSADIDTLVDALTRMANGERITPDEPHEDRLSPTRRQDRWAKKQIKLGGVGAC